MSTAKHSSLLTKVSYGFGSIAYGIKDNGFNYFLIIFFSQTMGVDKGLVGLAILLAFLADAISDPLVGYLSDNTHSKWGRRHPWMYASALPIAIAYYYLWSPPADLSNNEMFFYILTIAILIRTFITFYEIPSSALVAEFTDDYDERTSYLGYRYFFGWAGGTLMAAGTLALILVPTETYTSGLMNKEAYSTYGLVAAILICFSILVSAFGTHHMIPHLKTPPKKTPFSFGRVFKEVVETLGNKSLGALFASALLGSVATGLSAGLSFYISAYFWGFSTDQMSLISLSVILSAFLALTLAPRISKWKGKKDGTIIVGVVAFTLMPLPVVLRLFDLMPENGSPILFPLIIMLTTFDVALIIIAQILSSSMVADLAEQTELKTGRRSEGILFAAITFSKKAVLGLGALMATMVLGFADFPEGVAPGQVPEYIVFNLGAYYAPTIFALWMLMIMFLKFYDLDRDTHEENLAKLAANSRELPSGASSGFPPT